MTPVTVGTWPLVMMIAGVVVLIVVAPVLRLQIHAWLSSVRISPLRIAAMFVRRSRPNDVVFALIVAKRRKVDLSVDQLESIAKRGGDVIGVVRALARTSEGRRGADVETLVALDLAGYDVLKLAGSDVDLRAALDRPEGRLEGLRKRQA